MKRAVCFLLVFAACREPPLDDLCGQTCTIKGACNSGLWACSDAGMTCEGLVWPTDETCNGVDDNCDGTVDELVEPCANGCNHGQRRCTNGQWLACDAPPADPETCNGLDDNCDGVADEFNNLPIELCYTRPGPWAGECRPGYAECVNGQTVCRGEVLPHAETCDGRDNDCDGRADEGTPSSELDICIVLDASGSMGGTMDAIYNAVPRFVQENAVTSWRFCLVTAPNANLDKYGMAPVFVADFDGGQNFLSAFRPECGTGGYGLEATLDGVDMAVRLPSWRSSARRAIVVFSDEYPQNYFGHTLAGVKAEAADAGIELYAFTDARYEWSLLTGDAGVFDIRLPDSAISRKMDDLFVGGICE